MTFSLHSLLLHPFNYSHFPGKFPIHGQTLKIKSSETRFGQGFQILARRWFIHLWFFIGYWILKRPGFLSRLIIFIAILHLHNRLDDLAGWVKQSFKFITKMTKRYGMINK